MIRYILSRVVIAALLLLGLITLSFLLVSLMPGDPAVVLLGNYATPEDIARIHEQLGLDLPYWERYLQYMGRTLSGDLGTSFFTGASVSAEMIARLPNTLIYLVPGLFVALVFGVALGTLAAYQHGRVVDRGFTVIVSILMATPEFILALLLIFVFYQQMNAAPAPIGIVSPQDVVPSRVTGSIVIDAALAGDWGTIGSIFNHAGLLILTLGLFFTAFFGKTVRTGLIQVLNSPQIEFARACGLGRWRTFLYALSDVRGTLMTYGVLLFAASLSGAAIVESVFSWPGIGGWSLKGVLAGDVPVIQGFVIIMGVASLFGYVILDTLITLFDPRIRAAAIPRTRPNSFLRRRESTVASKE